MSEAPYKVCPECRVEYRQDAMRCIDCRVDLVHPDAVPEEEALAAFPPAGELDCVRVAPLAWMRALSEALQQEGVTHRVEPARSEDAPESQQPELFRDVELFGLYVRSEDAPLARELDGTIAAILLPEEAPEVAEGEVEACPACASPLPADATECPDCGLGFA